MRRCKSCGEHIRRGKTGEQSQVNNARCVVCITAHVLATMPTPPAVARARVEAAIKRALRGEVRPQQNRTP